MFTRQVVTRANPTLGPLIIRPFERSSTQIEEQSFNVAGARFLKLESVITHDFTENLKKVVAFFVKSDRFHFSSSYIFKLCPEKKTNFQPAFFFAVQIAENCN